MIKINVGKHSYQLDLKMNKEDELRIFHQLAQLAGESVTNIKEFNPTQGAGLLGTRLRTVESKCANIQSKVLEEANKLESDCNLAKEPKSEAVNIEDYLEEKENNFSDDRIKRLIMADCPVCHRRIINMTTENRLTCCCGHTINFDESELKDANYECNLCHEGTGKFKVYGHIDTVSCVNCRGGLKLEYDKATRTFSNTEKI